MSRRFQFSLAKSLIAVGLLCVALVLGRWTVSVPWGSDQGVVLVSAIGIALAAAVGVIADRWLSFSIGAAIGIGTCVAYLYLFSQIRAAIVQ